MNLSSPFVLVPLALAAFCAIPLFPRILDWTRGVWAREFPLSIDEPFPCSGRPDLIRWERNLSLTIVDAKTRPKPFTTKADVIQLSCYALMLRKFTFLPVRNIGIVLVILPDGTRRELPVKLLSKKELVRVYQAWRDIQEGRSEGAMCDNPNLCRNCGFRGRECAGRG